MPDNISYKGHGTVYIRERGASAGLIEMGNVSQLDFSVDEEVDTLRDYRKASGNVDEDRQITNVNMAMTLHNFSAANLARVLFGDASATVSGTVTGESVTAYEDAIVRLAHPNPTSVSITGHTEGTDYEVKAAGIYIIPGGGISDDDTLSVDYAYGAYETVEALTQSAKEYELVFDGVNRVNSNKTVVVDVFRVKLGALQGWGLISDEFGSIEVSGGILSDPTKGSSVSSYFRELAQS